MVEDVCEPLCQALQVFPLKQLHVAAVAVGEREVQVMAPAASVVFKKVGLAKVHLCFARDMDKGHVKLVLLAVELLLPFGYILRHQAVGTIKARTV